MIRPFVRKETLSELLFQDNNESLDRYNFRKRYTEKSFELLKDKSDWTAEQLIELGRMKTNSVFDLVKYPPKWEATITYIDNSS